MSLYDLTVKDTQGNDVKLDEFRGKVLLIVNTATGCGFTPHYEPLEAMYRELKEQGFEILDFPCNQFANQAPGDADEIHQFCTLKFGTEFPQFFIDNTQISAYNSKSVLTNANDHLWFMI